MKESLQLIIDYLEKNKFGKRQTVRFNDISDTGYAQSDGSIIQITNAGFNFLFSDFFIIKYFLYLVDSKRLVAY